MDMNLLSYLAERRADHQRNIIAWNSQPQDLPPHIYAQAQMAAIEHQGAIKELDHLIATFTK